MNSPCCSFSSTFSASKGGSVVVIFQVLALLQYSLMPYFKWPSPFIILHMFSSWYCIVATRQTKWDMCKTFILLQIIISLKAMWNKIPLFCYKLFFLWENHHSTTISFANAYSMSFFVCFLFMKCVQESDYGS